VLIEDLIDAGAIFLGIVLVIGLFMAFVYKITDPKTPPEDWN
jgi:hypothetical protein